MVRLGRFWTYTLPIPILLLAVQSIGQINHNLILNGGFDVVMRCPEDRRRDELKELPFWNSPTITTPDFYNDCGYKLPCVEPHDGEGYAGGLNVEYLEGQLKCPLQKGMRFRFEIFLQPAVSCLGSFVSDGFGVVFTSDQLSRNRRTHKDLPPELIPDITSPVGVLIKDTAGWTRVSGDYKAEGGERFFTIGFFPREDYSVEHFRTEYYGRPAMWKKGWRIKKSRFMGPHYYLYDSVSLLALDSIGEVDTTYCRELVEPAPIGDVDYSLATGGAIIVPELRFKQNESTLSRGSLEGLRYIWGTHLHSQGDEVKLFVHSTSTNEQIESIRLSELRCETIRQALLSWGIPQGKVDCVAVGDGEPLPDDLKGTLGISHDRVEIKVTPGYGNQENEE